MIKHLNYKQVREEGFILIHNPRYKSIIAKKTRLQELITAKHIGSMVRSGEKWTHACSMFSSLCGAQGMKSSSGATTLRLDVPTSVKAINATLRRYAHRSTKSRQSVPETLSLGDYKLSHWVSEDCNTDVGAPVPSFLPILLFWHLVFPFLLVLGLWSYSCMVFGSTELPSP